jgi:cellobiose phosphorylase
MASAEKHLYREYGPLLLTPGYSVTDPSIGYITRYAPSVRENGGLYTHAGNWAIQAECILRNGEKAYQLYRSFCPPVRGLDPDRYFAEPYVTPGNVDGPDSPNFGRGGWSWYTGSAQWYYTVAMNWILGVRPTKEGLLVDPIIPSAWPGFRMKRKFRNTTYEIEVKNPNGVYGGVKEVRIDGKAHASNILPAFADGKTHRVEVVLGS